MAQVVVQPIEYKDKEVLRNLMEFYLYDFSEMERFDVYPHGRFEYKYLDHYWTEAGRFPYFILVDGLYAGFVLVSPYGIFNNDSLSISEFFIMRKYRKSGIGEESARQVFDRHRGNWEVKEMKSNVGAQAFWRKVIKRYTNDHYEEVLMDDERWKGPIQTFNNQKEAE
jgi:predicted acetyltransferase